MTTEVLFPLQTSFLAIGVSAMLLTLADTFAWLIVIALMLGLFDGCFIALVGPIAFDLCGPQSASQAIGFLLGLYAVPMTAGPTIAGRWPRLRPTCARLIHSFVFVLSTAGILYEKWGSYRIPFLLSGCPPILCAIIMCFIRGGASAAATSALDDVAGVKRAPSKRKTSAMPVDGDVHHQQFQSKVYLSPDPAATKPSSGETCAVGPLRSPTDSTPFSFSGHVRLRLRRLQEAPLQQRPYRPPQLRTDADAAAAVALRSRRRRQADRLQRTFFVRPVRSAELTLASLCVVALRFSQRCHCFLCHCRRFLVGSTTPYSALFSTRQSVVEDRLAKCQLRGPRAFPVFLSRWFSPLRPPPRQ